MNSGRGWMLKRLVALLLAALSSGLYAQMPPSPAAEAAVPPVVLVELFTSEGCSSCPPADDLLRQIDGRTTPAGQRIVAISEHVTYWNHLGWSDPYSEATYTARQNAYGARFGLDSVYTPQMVVNGAEQFVGSDKSALLRALRQETGKPRISVRILSAAVADGSLRVVYSVSGPLPTCGVNIIAVLADDSDRDSVRGGENSGRELSHVAVARLLTQVAILHRGAGGSALKETSLPLPASVRSTKTPEHHLILFAQTANLGPILGADTRAF